MARLTWLVLVLVFIGLLGGFHPSDRTRDAVVAAAAVLVVLFNLPAAVAAARHHRARDLLGVALRLAVAACVLVFVRGISHGPVDWDAKDASRHCGSDAPWPGEPAARCRALHLCANESPVEDPDLHVRIAATPGCPAP